MLEESRKARAALRRTAHGSPTYSSTLWQRITSNDSSRTSLLIAQPRLVSIQTYSATPASCAARSEIFSISAEASSSVT